MEPEQRRYADQIDKASDHDLLIKAVTHLESICNKQDSAGGAVKELSGKMDNRSIEVDKKLDKKLDSLTFWRLVIVLTVIVSGLCATVAINSKTIVENKTNIAHQSEEGN
jgi:hypothetical protein